MRFDNDSLPAMFEPEAEGMPAEQLLALQTRRLRVLIDRLLAAGGVQAGRLAEAGVTGWRRSGGQTGGRRRDRRGRGEPG
jgi:hypothetical protein